MAQAVGMATDVAVHMTTDPPAVDMVIEVIVAQEASPAVIVSR